MDDFVDPQTGELVNADGATEEGQARILEIQQLALLKLRDDVTALTSELAETVKWLRDRLGEAGADEAAADAQWCWRIMPAERAQQLWGELSEWVGYLRGRYPLAGVIPACWWRHGELVEELTALYRAWLGGVAGGTSGTYNGIEWHDRWLPGVCQRVKTWGLDRCAHQRQHHAKPTDSYDPHPVDDSEAYAAMVAADLAERRARKPKRPHRMPEAEMEEHLAAGRAQRLGDLPGSPVRYGDTFWRRVPDGYEQITDEALLARLRRDAARLTAADEAIRRASVEEPGER